MVQIDRRSTARRLLENFKKNSQKSQNTNFKILVHHFWRLCLLCIVKKFDSIGTKLTEEIDFEVFPMAIPAMALLQQHDARRDILIEPAARRRAVIEARVIRNWGRSELRAQSGCKNQPACCLACRAPTEAGVKCNACIHCVV